MMPFSSQKYRKLAINTAAHISLYDAMPSQEKQELKQPGVIETIKERFSIDEKCTPRTNLNHDRETAHRRISDDIDNLAKQHADNS